jgi:hypothetical protein
MGFRFSQNRNEMTTTPHDRHNATPESASSNGGTGRGRSCLSILIFIFVLAPCAFGGAKLALQTSTGFAITPSGGNYQSSFGTMNALAIGATQAGVKSAALSNGAMYFTTFDVSVSAMGNSTGVVKAYVSTNFTGFAASAMVLYGCPSTSACNSSAQFASLGTVQGSALTLATGLTKTLSTATVGLAIFLPDNDGASAFANTASAIVSFDLYLDGAITTTDTATLNLNNPSETVQTAVQLTLAQAASGRAITPGTDFTLAFGNVNALGIGAGAGLTPVAQAGGIIYSTPYNLLPIFTGFSSTTSTINACVNTTFAHSTILVLKNSSTGTAGTFANISTTCGTATSITNTAGDRSTITNYLGLFVSNVNGATAFVGLDNASLTYTLTVP